jgi:hypothetical protein
MSHYDFPAAFSPSFVAFVRRYLGAPGFRPRSAPGAGPTDPPGVCGTGCSRPVDFEEPSGSPKFPGNPPDHSPCSPTPAGPGTRCGTRGQRTRRGPRLEPRRGRPTTESFRGSITRRLVWLSTPRGGGLPPLHARLASPGAPGLAPALPGGIRTRRVPTKGFRVWLTLPPFPSFLGARFVSSISRPPLATRRRWLRFVVSTSPASERPPMGSSENSRPEAWRWTHATFGGAQRSR